MGNFLPYSALPGLKAYKYSSEDRSLVSRYVLKPFYVRIVEFLPRWLAPNMVTLLGLLFSVISFTRAFYYDFDLNTPRWVYFAHALDLFLYQTLDALDGQQARRTGTSSPLGELFDHCVDAMNTSLQAYVVSTVMTLPKHLVLFSQFMCTINFFLSTWEEYHTHKLFLSIFSGPVEGILIMVAAEVITGIYGPEIWFNDCGFHNLHFTFRDIAIFASSVGLIFNSISALSNVRKATKNKFVDTLSGVIPLTVMWMGFGGWAYIAWETIEASGFLPFFLSAGFTFALLVGRIITAHVTSQSYPMWTTLLILPYVGIVLHIIAPGPHLQHIWALFGISCGVYSSFVAEVISEITTYLDIGCLYIKHRSKLD